MRKNNKKRKATSLNNADCFLAERNPEFNSDAIPKIEIDYIESFDLIDPVDLEGNNLIIENNQDLNDRDVDK